MSTKAIGRAVLLVALCVVTAGAAAALSPASIHHTDYGVSQFWAGHASGNSSYTLHLQNPTPVTMIAGVLLYERALVDDDSSDPDATGTVIHPDLDPAFDTANRPGDFVNCWTVELEPHAAFNFDDGFTYYSVFDDERSYLEIIAVPATKQTVGSSSTRLADGLGILARGSGWTSGSLMAVNPTVFDEPSGDADSCLCDAVSAFASGDDTLWDDFGVSCP